MYVLIAKHDTSQSLDAAVVIVTSSLKKALAVGRRIEVYNYQFHSDAAGVFLFDVPEGTVLDKTELTLFPNSKVPPDRYPIKYAWKKIGSEWRELEIEANICCPLFL